MFRDFLSGLIPQLNLFFVHSKKSVRVNNGLKDFLFGKDKQKIQKQKRLWSAIFFAAAVFHGTAAAGVSFFAVVDCADDSHYDQARYGNDCYDSRGIHKACALKYPNHATNQAIAHWNITT